MRKVFSVICILSLVFAIQAYVGVKILEALFKAPMAQLGELQND